MVANHFCQFTMSAEQSALNLACGILPERHLRAAPSTSRGHKITESLQGRIILQFLARRPETGRKRAGVMQVGGDAVINFALQQLVGAALRLGAVETGKGAKVGLIEAAVGKLRGQWGQC